MLYKVKQHLRKTKKGLVTVKESNRKDKAKKALVVGAAALTTLGIGALAYKRLGSKLVDKVDDVAKNKGTKLLSSAKPKQTLPDPWLDDAVTTVKSSNPLTVPKSEQKLLTPYKYKAPEYNPPTTRSKGFFKEDGTPKSLKEAISSTRTLIKREPTDIKNAIKQLDLADRYKASDSPSLRRTGNSYEDRANKNLAKIAKRGGWRRKKQGLITVKGKTRNSVRMGESSQLILKKKLEEAPKATTELVKPKANKSLADTLGQSVLKDEMNKKINQSLDDVIPGSGLVRAKVKDVKDRIRQVERYSNELEEIGDKVGSRRGFFKTALNKVVKESAKKPKDPTNIARGVVTKTKVTIRRGNSKLNTEPTRASRAAKGLQVDVNNVKRVYRKPRGLLERMTQTMKKVARYKSGNTQT